MDIRSFIVDHNIKREQVISIVSITVATAFLFSYLRKQTKKDTLKKIPAPSFSLPYAGHLFSLGKTPNVKVIEWHQQLGPIFQLHIGVKRWIMIDDPELLHRILVSNGADTSYRRQSVYSGHYSFKGHGLVYAQPDAAWKRSRAAALTLMAPKHIHTYMDSVRYESVALVDRLIEATNKNGSVDPRRDLLLSSFNVIYKLGFGKRFDRVSDPAYVEFSSIIEQSMSYTDPKYNLSSYLPIIKIVDYYVGLEAMMKDFIENIRNPFLRKLIDNAQAEEGSNIVKSLGEETFKMTDDEKLVFMSDMFLAGTDTISITLSWNFAIMCTYPDVQQRVMDEIDEFIKTHGRMPQFEDREMLPLCISVIKECMRFKPTTPFGVAHTTIKDVVVDGYFIPKSATIYSSMESMHRKRDGYYEDADKFVPERFMGNLKTMLAAANGNFKDRDHFNFGWGRRICPGIHLADVEIFCTFVELFARCRIEATNELPDITKTRIGGVTILPLPYQIKVVKRGDALV